MEKHPVRGRKVEKAAQNTAGRAMRIEFGDALQVCSGSSLQFAAQVGDPLTVEMCNFFFTPTEREVPSVP